MWLEIRFRGKVSWEIMDSVRTQGYPPPPRPRPWVLEMQRVLTRGTLSCWMLVVAWGGQQIRETILAFTGPEPFPLKCILSLDLTEPIWEQQPWAWGLMGPCWPILTLSFPRFERCPRTMWHPPVLSPGLIRLWGPVVPKESGQSLEVSSRPSPPHNSRSSRPLQGSESPLEPAGGQGRWGL